MVQRPFTCSVKDDDAIPARQGSLQQVVIGAVEEVTNPLKHFGVEDCLGQSGELAGWNTRERRSSTSRFYDLYDQSRLPCENFSLHWDPRISENGSQFSGDDSISPLPPTTVAWTWQATTAESQQVARLTLRQTLLRDRSIGPRFHRRDALSHRANQIPLPACVQVLAAVRRPLHLCSKPNTPIRRKF